MDDPGGGAEPPTIEDANMEINGNDNTLNLDSGRIAKKNHLYSYTDARPYEVYMQATNGHNIGNYNHLAIAKEVFNLKLGDISKISKKGKNRISVEFKNYTAANNFVTNEALRSRGYEMFIPSNNVTCKGIVRYVEKNLSEQEILNYSSCKNVNIKVLGVRRLNRRVKEGNVTNYIPTGTVCLTFSGKILPREVEIYNLAMRVEPYIMPVIQCYNCLRFGHTKTQCRGKVKCVNCSKDHENECQFQTKCLHCDSGDHNSTSKICPEYSRQRRIKEIMSLDNLSFFDAQQLVPKPNFRQQEAFSPRMADFPKLPSTMDPEIDIIPVSLRRSLLSQENPSVQKLTYSNKTQIDSSKKRKINYTPGYNKQQHEECLISPSGRNQFEDIYYIPDSPSTSRENQHPTTAEDIIKMIP